MKKTRRLLIPLFLAAVVVAITPLTALAATLPLLGTAGNFAVLANTTITNTGPSWITGQIGVATPPGAITNFPPGTSGAKHHADSTATTAETNLVTGYNDASQPCTTTYTGVNLGGKTLVPGVYCQTTAPTLTGTLTLKGAGVYIFKIGSTLVTANSASVVLIGGAQPCDIFWQVASSATIAPSTTFVGNIMAVGSIAMQTGATLNGRALARTGAVTLDTNRIIQPAGCGYSAPTYVGPPNGNILPASLGVPSELVAEVPWLFLIAVGSGFAALTLGLTSRRRRRRTA